MERVISSKFRYWAICAISLFLIVTICYVAIGEDESKFWWALDKVNDRLLTINLLLITSFTFTDAFYRFFGVISAFFIAIYASYEVSWIYGIDIQPIDFAIIAFVYWLLISVLFFILQNDK